MLKQNGSQETKINDREKNAAIVVGQIWGIGERRYERHEKKTFVI